MHDFTEEEKAKAISWLDKLERHYQKEAQRLRTEGSENSAQASFEIARGAKALKALLVKKG